jgi:hypothetical protein
MQDAEVFLRVDGHTQTLDERHYETEQAHHSGI